MAHGQNAEKRGNVDKEWWGKRPKAGYPISNNSKINKFFKRLVHRIERRMGKEINCIDCDS